ncbi:hypothetical protein Y032_0023g677 [Ancylostoma ceylanicum]|uniref:Uncharacterized protein n=1 Tax=Ancylostoma ceylanicum TaxID=53326 RepID=A0A016UXH5_9BILA|nr:hypothetical protein Y032_0023g677 [Ancylostoma ceylanicum]
MICSRTKATRIYQHHYSVSISGPTVNGLEWIYLQCCLVTGLYMLEPWERKLFTSIAVLSISVFVALTISTGRAVFA